MYIVATENTNLLTTEVRNARLDGAARHLSHRNAVFALQSIRTKSRDLRIVGFMILGEQWCVAAAC